MKKYLILASIVSLLFAQSSMAADTYVGSYLEKQQKKVDVQANKLIEKEKSVREKQKAAQELRAQQAAEKKRQIEAKKKAQEDLVKKKKQQAQAVRDNFKQQKNEIKDIFSVK